MGLSLSLANALSGMKTTQSGLEILSRNVANAGTPGYHRQALTITEQFSGTSAYVRQAAVARAFQAALEAQTHSETGRMGRIDVRAEFLSRLELYLGMPGDANALDTKFASFRNSLQELATSPNDYATRNQVIAHARSMVETLNNLSGSIQTMRREAEGQISGAVGELNRALSSLQQINRQLADAGRDETSRAMLMDERDRLVTQVSELIDVRADYQADGRVILQTRNGIGLVDEAASVFEFTPAGNLSPLSLYNQDDGQNGVGSLKLRTPAGLEIDLIDSRALQSGRLKGLIDMRDNTLVQAQAQLDEIAAAMAMAMSTIETEGAAVSSGGADGYEVDLGNILPGNEFSFTYTVGGVPQTVRVVRVDDPALLPMDSTSVNGVRTIGLDFSGGIGAVATALNTALGPDISFGTTGSVLQVLDDGAGDTSDVTSLTARPTATGTQGEGLGLALFLDANGQPFTNALDGTPQKLGFAARIVLNPAVAADNTLLVRYEASTPLGDAARPQYILDKLNNLAFAVSAGAGYAASNFGFTASAGQLIEQMMNFQGNAMAATEADHATQATTMETVAARASKEYGVNIDEEMARLIDLQNAYAANARVVSIVKELIDTLLSI